MENNILTPSAIWKDFQVEGDTKTSIIKEETADGILMREVYFNARRVEDGVTRVYAMFCCPQDGARHPAVLLCHNRTGGMEPERLAEFARKGLAVLCFDYWGERESVGRYTIYPRSISYANLNRAGEHLVRAEPDALHTTFYEWTCVARYAAAVLAAQPEVEPGRICALGIRGGGYLAWQLAAFCPEVAGACSMFEAGWEECETFKYALGAEDGPLTPERERWLAGVATQVYAPHVKVPFLYLGATNDWLGNMDRAADTLVRLEGKSWFAFAPRLTDMVNGRCIGTLKCFLDGCFTGDWGKLPEKPSLIFLEREGRLAVRFRADESRPVRAVRLYYALAEPNPAARNWCEISAVRGEDGYYGEVPEYESGELVFAYGAVEYGDGAYLTTNLAVIRPSDIGAPGAGATRVPMLYNGAMGTDSFTVVGTQAHGLPLSVPDDPLEVAEGPFGIRGITAKVLGLATFKVGDIRYRGEGESLLKFDVYASERCELTVTLVEAYATKAEKRYRQRMPLLGGELWQKIDLEISGFKTDDGLPLKGWEYADALVFECTGRYLINNMLWL